MMVIFFMVNSVDFIRNSKGFKDFIKYLEGGTLPQVLCVKAPKILHEDCSRVFAKAILCNNYIGDDNCSSCKEWHDGSHPDLIYSGLPEKAPGIDRCREIHSELCLRSVVAKHRVAVIFMADRLSVHASNNMLKLAEEPPENAVIIFLLEEYNLLPTLSSRVWPVTISQLPPASSRPIPGSDEEWIEWSSDLHREDTGEILKFIEAWISYALENGEYIKAGKMEKIRIIAKSQKISQAMLEDLIILTIKEGIPFEHIFGDIW